MKNPRKIQKGSESMNEKDEKKAPQTFSVRTDLAIEARELAQKDTTDALEGVAVETDEQADYSLTRGKRAHGQADGALYYTGIGKAKGK